MHPAVAFAEADNWYVPVLSNAAALIYDAMEGLNWAGFCLMRGGRLVLGPFQGKEACIRIAVGKGVCGTAVAEDCTQRVADVHAFAGHIACDSASNSKIVTPIHGAGAVWTPGLCDGGNMRVPRNGIRSGTRMWHRCGLAQNEAASTFVGIASIGQPASWVL